MSKQYKPLFDHMFKEHGVTLTDSEMQDIIWIVEKLDKDKDDSNHVRKGRTLPDKVYAWWVNLSREKKWGICENYWGKKYPRSDSDIWKMYKKEFEDDKQATN